MTPLAHAQPNSINATASTTYSAIPQRIILVTQNRSIRVSTDEIVWLEGAGNYTFVHTRDKRRYLMVKTLKMFQQELTSESFSRIHKSYVVNLAHVRNINFGSDACLELVGGQVLTIARRRLTPTLNQYLHHQQRAIKLN